MNWQFDFCGEVPSGYDLTGEEVREAAQIGVAMCILESQEASKMQTVLLSKTRFKSEEEARKWAGDHHFKTTKVDAPGKNYRFRQFEPSRCKEGSFRNIALSEGVQGVICRLKE